MMLSGQRALVAFDHRADAKSQAGLSDGSKNHKPTRPTPCATPFLHAVLGIAIAIQRQSYRRYPITVCAHGKLSPKHVFVDVITEEQHRVGVLIGEVGYAEK